MRPRLSHWSRPRWRDRAFWAAIGLAAVLFGIQLAIIGIPHDGLAWVALAVRLVLTWVVVSALMRIRVGLERGLVRGFEEADERAATRPSGMSAPEAVARSGGRTVGRALGAYRRTREQK
jgi:hypothetical protein